MEALSSSRGRDDLRLFRAGSMSGSRIQAAKTALLVLLKSLPPGCYFNIVGFGSTFALLFPEYGLFYKLRECLQ